MNQNIESRIQDDHVCMLYQEEQFIPYKQWKPVFDPSEHMHIMVTQWQSSYDLVEIMDASA